MDKKHITKKSTGQTYTALRFASAVGVEAAEKS
jgi:hypothetical protein